jgi:2-desacetyl-2-hydroxyethyl bacteriochlorophyllide A dehydrogenase
MKRQALYFLAPGRVEVREEDLSPPAEGQLLVKTICSAVSPGTEMLYYRGQVPEDLFRDAGIASLQGAGGYPLKYGYSCVGQVVDAVSPGGSEWIGRRVFSFHPHESAFWADGGDLIPLPDDLAPERSVFLPNMETALNFIMDARPLAGEFAAVFGLGVVGLLSAALLAQFPLAGLVGFDRFVLRRGAGLGVGLTQAFDPDDHAAWSGAYADLAHNGMTDGFDLCLEVSGSPAALDQAIRLCGYTSRVVIGSWYGAKTAALDLGGHFHRDRIQLMSSQVSTVAPELSGRWSKSRRMVEALRQLGRIKPEKWITQRFALTDAAEAYRLLDQAPAEVIQPVFTYSPV